MSRIISIGTAVPAYGTSQKIIFDFMSSAYRDEVVSRKLKILFNASGIKTRYSVLPDFDNSTPVQILFDGVSEQPMVDKRLGKFKEHSVSLAIDAIYNAFNVLNITVAEFQPSHLITVTCTGVHAPGMHTSLIEMLNLPDDIFHTSVNFMGCNAAFHAMKIADLIAKTDENARILIACVELCTLHFQPKNTNDNLLSNAIFADGAAAAIMVSDKAATTNRWNGFEVLDFYAQLFKQGKKLMEWNVTPVNFEMVLNAEVPEFIGDVMSEVLEKAGKKFGVDKSEIDKWAIHPGGKKILDVIRKKQGFSGQDLLYSYKVLEEFGNMSSPTILFVLHEIAKSQPKPNEKVFSVGFGPGLSVETCLLRYA